jgi:Putative zinc-finger
MSQHPSERTIQRHVDGELTPSERWEVERHLYACPSCDRQRETYAKLIDEVGGLSASIQPPRDLWPGITSRLVKHPARQTLEPPSRRRRSVRMAAAVLAVAAALTLGLALGRQLPAPLPNIVAEASPDAEAAAVLASYDDTGYQSAIADLERLLVETRGQLQPETIATVEENLAIIDRAIADSRAAILADPANEQLHRHLAMTMQMKISLLRMVTGAATAEI